MTKAVSAAHSIRQELVGIAIFIGIIWLIFLLDRILPLERLALYPRRLGGLPGVIASPFLHKDIAHIIANTTPLFVLLTVLAGARARSTRAVFLIVILSGGLLWIFGRPVPVIGASGLVFGLIGFLIASGIIERRPIAMIVSLLVGFSYGGTLLAGILPGQPGISWDGHLFGALGGVLSAWLLRR